jgi:hypothetical protein
MIRIETTTILGYGDPANKRTIFKLVGSLDPATGEVSEVEVYDEATGKRLPKHEVGDSLAKAKAILLDYARKEGKLLQAPVPGSEGDRLAGKAPGSAGETPDPSGRNR